MNKTENYNPETMTKAVGRSLNLSVKTSSEVCRFIRGKNVKKAITLLQEVEKKKRALPFTRFNRGGTGHKPGIGPGRYPLKTCAEMIRLLKEIESNAKNKSIDAESLIIKHIVANKAGRQPRYGRHRGRVMKRTHIEIIAEPDKTVKIKKKESKKTEKKQPAEKKTPVQDTKSEAKPLPEEKK